MIEDVRARKVRDAPQPVWLLTLQEEIADQRDGAGAVAVGPADGGQHHPFAQGLSGHSRQGGPGCRRGRDGPGSRSHCVKEIWPGKRRGALASEDEHGVCEQLFAGLRVSEAFPLRGEGLD